jgi:hypothetical protein
MLSSKVVSLQPQLFFAVEAQLSTLFAGKNEKTGAADARRELVGQKRVACRP